MPNHLAGENSPYLLQHADNPVDWYPWGTEALERARHEDKPIFLSIGYAACHWCHVMAHESFENLEIAAIMNAHFINIKVDREERPDIDAIYMNAVVAMTGQGGWPTSVFLTPDGLPFFGGTYFPPVRRYNMPSFPEVLLRVAQVWSSDRQGILDSSRQITQILQQSASIDSGEMSELDPKLLSQSTAVLAKSYDWNNGGWGPAPKFPQAMAIEFLLIRAARGDLNALNVAAHALKAMARGGIYDVVGGGFARYSTDERWLIPHFEKMLYDNALLSRAYLHAYLITHDENFRLICTATLDFVMRELVHPQGGFFSSLDADSDGTEGKYYLWTIHDIRRLLGEEADFFLAAYNVTENGNFDGQTVLQRSQSDEKLVAAFKMQPPEIPIRLSALHHILLKEREQRTRPSIDDKVLTSWNALMLLTFAEAGRYLGESKYTNVAMRNASFIIDNMVCNGQLYHSWREGKAQHPAYLEDYAALGLALLALYQTAPQPRWFSTAKHLAEYILENFADQQNGFYDTARDHKNLIMRPKDIQDNATPSGNSLTAMFLLQLSAYTSNLAWRDIAETMLRSKIRLAAKYPAAFGAWLCAFDFAMYPVCEVAIIGNPTDTPTIALINALNQGYNPSLLVAISDYPPSEDDPELLHSRPMKNGLPTAYVCKNAVCLQPVNEPADLLTQLSR